MVLEREGWEDGKVLISMMFDDLFES